MTFGQRACAMLQMRIEGRTYREIGSRFNVNSQRAYQVVQKKIDSLFDGMFAPETPEDQYLFDAVSDSPYLARRGRIIFIDIGEEL